MTDDAAGAGAASGDILEIGPTTRLVVGRPLDLDRGEAAVANVVHLSTETNSFLPGWPDSDPFQAIEALVKARLTPGTGAVETVADGHRFRL